MTADLSNISFLDFGGSVPGVLWADRNVGAVEVTDGGTMMTYEEALRLQESLPEGIRLPRPDEVFRLAFFVERDMDGKIDRDTPGVFTYRHAYGTLQVPLAGCRLENGEWVHGGRTAFLWTSVEDSTPGCEGLVRYWTVARKPIDICLSGNRMDRLCVRLVKEKEEAPL